MPFAPMHFHKDYELSLFLFGVHVSWKWMTSTFYDNERNNTFELAITSHPPWMTLFQLLLEYYYHRLDVTKKLLRLTNECLAPPNHIVFHIIRIIVFHKRFFADKNGDVKQSLSFQLTSWFSPCSGWKILALAGQLGIIYALH